MRRGVADLDGRGETVSGIVVMRQGADVVDVIDRVKPKLKQIAPGLPPGVRVVPVYDRSDLVHRVIDNLRSTLHRDHPHRGHRDPAVPVAPAQRRDPHPDDSAALLDRCRTIPLMGLSFNVMSLGGFAIAAGALVDAAIVVVEQTHKKLEEWQGDGSPGDAEASS